MKTLYVFDFDDTLYRSTKPPLGGGMRWWALPKSLQDVGPPGLDTRWNLEVLYTARRAVEDPLSRAVVITGRPYTHQLYHHLIRILAAASLVLPVHLRPFMALDIPRYKVDVLSEHLATEVYSKVVSYEDDITNLRSLAKHTKGSGLPFEGYLVRGGRIRRLM